MMTSIHPRGRAVFVLLAPLLLIGAYVGSYFAVLALPAGIQFPRMWGREPSVDEIVGRWGSDFDRDTSGDIILSAPNVINRPLFPNYHGLPPSFFGPAHQWDRAYFRPGYWW
jgi:hypothetical protein